MNQNTPKQVAMKDWRRSSPIQFWERNPDAIGRKMYVNLAHPVIVKLLITSFEPFTRLSYYVSCLARNILSDNLSRATYKEEELFGAEMAIADGLTSLHEYFDTRIEQGRVRLEMSGFSIDDTRANSVDYETMSVTNATSNYLEVLIKADMCLMMIHYLWLTGDLASNPRDNELEKQRSEKEVREAIVNFCRMSERHYQQIQRICKEALAQAAERMRQKAIKLERKRKRDNKRGEAIAQAQGEQTALASVEQSAPKLPVITQDDLVFAES
jgi:hypothetical protein